MASYQSSLDRLARSMSRQDSLVRIPPQPQLRMHQGIITAASVTSLTCSVEMFGQVIPNITYLLNYGPDFHPETGHTCLVHMNGNDPVVMGRLISS